ncbi:MAG: MFS transporter [Promethearchaeota archaeon]
MPDKNSKEDSELQSETGVVDSDKVKNKRLVGLGLLLFFPLVILSSSDGAILASNQVLIMADMEMSVTMFGWLVGIGVLFQGVFTFIFGYLADKYPRKWLLVIGGTAWTISLFIMLSSPTVPILFVARMIGTVGLGAVSPVVFSLLSDMFPSEKRSKSFAWWGIATMVGGLLGAGLGLAFNTIPFEDIPNWDVMSIVDKMIYLKTHYDAMVSNWRLSYELVAILAIVFVVLCVLVKEPKRGSKDAQFRDILADDDLKYTYKIKRGDLKYIFTRRSNFWLIFNFLDVVVSGFFIANIVLFINEELQFDFGSAESIGQLAIFILPAIGLGLFGQFFFARMGDKRVKRGDPAGRVKIAILGGVLHIPFFVAAMLFAPNKPNSTFFFGTLAVPAWGFWILMLFFGIILGFGLMFSFAIAPNWYASLIDVNLPEHRGTMLATAAFLDTIGRSFGAIVGGMLISFFDSSGTSYAISTSILWMTVVFGGISALMWLPIYKYCNKDFGDIQRILSDRARELEKK